MSYNNKPLWTTINKVPYTYPWLFKDEKTSVCIIGGGIQTALCAFKFASAGISTVVLCPDPVAFGETSFLDGTIKTDICGGLVELSLHFGMDFATSFYNMCDTSMNSLENIALLLGNDCNFKRCDSLIYSKNDDSTYDLRKEYLFRRYSGFSSNLFPGKNFSFNRKSKIQCCLVTKNKSAIVDPFILTHMLMNAAQKLGTKVYENSPVENIVSDDSGVSVFTESGKTVCSKKLLVFPEQKLMSNFKNVGSLKTRFSVITKPIENSVIRKFKNTVITKLEYPERVISVTNDRRVIATELSSNFVNKKSNDVKYVSTIKKIKFLQLEKDLKVIFPQLTPQDIEHRFSYNHFNTSDGLPLIFQKRKYKNCYFICPGNEDILGSEITANMLLNIYEKKEVFPKQFLLPPIRRKKRISSISEQDFLDASII